MAEKVTRMLIKVDLQCGKCCRKIKKILCRFPQIRDQVYDEKANTVMITVVCCSPEKIKDKICCKGRDTILGIEIIPDKPKEPEKPKQPEKPKEPEKPKQPEKPKEPEKPKQTEKPKEPEKPKETKTVVIVEPPKEKPAPQPKAPEPAAKPPQQAPPAKAPEPAAKPAPQPQPKAPEPLLPMPQVPASGYPPVYNVGMCCCQPCYEGYGPCYSSYRPAPMCYDGYGRPPYDCQGGSRGYQGNRCDYFSEENASGCNIM